MKKQSQNNLPSLPADMEVVKPDLGNLYGLMLQVAKRNNISNSPALDAVKKLLEGGSLTEQEKSAAIVDADNFGDHVYPNGLKTSHPNQGLGALLQYLKEAPVAYLGSEAASVSVKKLYRLASELVRLTK